MTTWTHRLRRYFHRKLRPWRSDEQHDKLQLINVYPCEVKEDWSWTWETVESLSR